eukprot:5334984-Heterocapsa_arctica.AAC.1
MSAVMRAGGLSMSDSFVPCSVTRQKGLGIDHPSLLASSKQMPMGPLTEAQLALGPLEAPSQACLS